MRCRPALPACLRLVFPSSRPISSIVVSIVSSPLFDTVGRGVRRGASVSCLLGSCPAVCADVDRSVHGVSSAVSPLSAFYVVSAAGAMAFSSHPSSRPCWMRCGVLLARRLVSSFASAVVPSVGSAHRLSPRLATRLAGRRADALRLRRAIVPRSDFAACLVPRACLPCGVSRHPSDTDGGGGLRSIGSACSACLPRCIRAASCRSVVPFHESFDWCGSVPLP